MLSRTKLMATLLFVLLANILFAQYTLEALEAERKRQERGYIVPALNDTELKNRLSTLNGSIPCTFNPVTKGYIRTYTIRRRERTEKMLGRAMMYYPIMEEALRHHGLPDDIKYLSVVESALNPKAVSPVGATGLWQFMPATGKMYNLNQNLYVDDRIDPYKASDGAARFLKDLYHRYGDWALALAAYNAGPGRVNRAIKLGKSKNFWKIHKYLPKETRNYVPAYMAAVYLAKYHEAHNLFPKHPPYNHIVTEKIRVYKETTFNEIVQATQIPYDVIQTLNPAYKHNVIPPSNNGYILTLPSGTAAFVKNIRPMSKMEWTYAAFQGGARPDVSSMRVSTKMVYQKQRKTYKVRRGDNLSTIARKLKCSVSSLKKWNGLRGTMIREGQRLKYYRKVSVPVETPIIVNVPKVPPIEQVVRNSYVQKTTPAPAPQPKKEVETPKPPKEEKEEVIVVEAPKTEITQEEVKETVEEKDPTTYHKVETGETLLQVIKAYNIKSIEAFRAMNNLDKNTLDEGMKLKIPTKEKEAEE